MKVLRFYHAGISCEERKRDESITNLGIDLLTVVPSNFNNINYESCVHQLGRVIPLPILNSKSVNFHLYASRKALGKIISSFDPDIVDIHEEPYSLVSRQIIGLVPKHVPIVHYTAQNIIKLLPLPFNLMRREVFRRVTSFYPCSNLAAKVLKESGYRGLVQRIPLGYDESVFFPDQTFKASKILKVAFVGRLVAEKGLKDVARIVSRLSHSTSLEFHVVGSGSYRKRLFTHLSNSDFRGSLEMHGWRSKQELAQLLRKCHFLLAPSRTTPNWKEQFGRMIIEAQACGVVIATYDSGSIGELCSGNSIMVEEGDWRLLADKLRELYADSNEYKTFVDLSLSNANSYTWPNVATAQLSFYKNCLQSYPMEGISRTEPESTQRGKLSSLSFVGKLNTQIRVLKGEL